MSTALVLLFLFIWGFFGFIIGYAKGQVDAEREALDR